MNYHNSSILHYKNKTYLQQNNIYINPASIPWTKFYNAKLLPISKNNRERAYLPFCIIQCFCRLVSFQSQKWCCCCGWGMYYSCTPLSPSPLNYYDITLTILIYAQQLGNFKLP